MAKSRTRLSNFTGSLSALVIMCKLLSVSMMVWRDRQWTALRHHFKPSVPGILFQPVLCRIPRLVYSQLRNAEELILCGTTLAQ